MASAEAAWTSNQGQSRRVVSRTKIVREHFDRSSACATYQIRNLADGSSCARAVEADDANRARAVPLLVEREATMAEINPCHRRQRQPAGGRRQDVVRHSALYRTGTGLAARPRAEPAAETHARLRADYVSSRESAAWSTARAGDGDDGHDQAVRRLAGKLFRIAAREADKVAALLRILLADPNVKAVLFISSRITRCDEVRWASGAMTRSRSSADGGAARSATNRKKAGR